MLGSLPILESRESPVSTTARRAATVCIGRVIWLTITSRASKSARVKQRLVSRPFILLALGSLGYSFSLLQLGAFPGANYDSYQYVYAVLASGRLNALELAEFGRLHVHAGYFPIWTVLSRLGLPLWQAAGWLSIGCTAATVGAIYLLARELGCRQGHALAAALLWQSFATVAFYANIPEIYAPWMLCLALYLLYLERERRAAATVCFAVATWLFLPSLLLLPAFARLSQRKLTAAAVGTGLGLGLHLLTLKAYGVPFLTRLASERVYWQVASGPLWYLTSTWKSMVQSGMGLALLCCLLPAWLLRRRLEPSLRRLMLLAIPLFLAPALWVKDHGSFFLPFGLMLCLIVPLLWQQWAGRHRWRHSAAIAITLLVVGPNVSSSWRQVSYDRNMGQAQVEFCRQAMQRLPENSQVLSTALLSTWLFVKEDAGRSDVECLYFPWMINQNYAEVIERSLTELQSLPGVYFVDPTVTTAVVQAGQLLQALPIQILDWDGRQSLWELKKVYLGETRP